ncbi:MAG: carboxylating nicotinate-nucleotide diphosphorylase [Thermodesulfobacteriota bacterium]|nr:carboxylating nicotinate-nucleotide diphosphorylase [Thermodesulfobacteriota bacterium]
MFQIDKLIELALEEDIPNYDITTAALISPAKSGKVEVTAKSDLVLAGLKIFYTVFLRLNADITIQAFFSDGNKVKSGEKIAYIEGSLHDILRGERTALNFLQRLSGIATLTARYVEKIKNYNVSLLDTRKTVPGWRILEKYAVRTGGGRNHRSNLGDGILIKDNHIAACGGIEYAVEKVRKVCPPGLKVEVEVNNLTEVKEALKAGSDIIMLDNMNPDDMKKAVKFINGKALIEASGNVNLDNIKEIAGTGINFISIGAITHSAPFVDISMELSA